VGFPSVANHSSFHYTHTGRLEYGRAVVAATTSAPSTTHCDHLKAVAVVEFESLVRQKPSSTTPPNHKLPISPYNASPDCLANRQSAGRSACS